MADIFLSYKKEDLPIADRVVTALRAEGFTVWWDDSLTPRTAWDTALEREIAVAAAVAVLWTPRSVASDWVRTEAHYAQDRGKLVPVMMETCSIPIAFMLKQTVNLSQWNGDRTDRGWRKLLTWIADLASTKPGNANIPRALGAARPNPFREALGHLAPGDPIVDGALVNASTPAATAFRDGDKMPVMRILPKGAFLLGSPPTDPDHAAVEGPQKRIEIPVPFAIGVFPVLVSEYQAITGTLPSVAVLPPPSHGLLGIFKHAAAQPASSVPLSPSAPVTYVSYDDAQAFIGGINAAAGETYRMPSEAEWEYACRAGSQTRYSCGDTITGSQALFAAKAGPAAPGAYPPNAFGLYDMHGNVREWTADLWHESYDATPLDGSPAIEGQGSMRVVRGGGWCDIASMLRSASRMRATQSSRYSMIGFRVARTLS